MIPPILPNEMQALIEGIRIEILGMSEAEAIDWVADQLNLCLVKIRDGELSDTQYAAMCIGVANVYVLKSINKLMRSDEKELRNRRRR